MLKYGTVYDGGYGFGINSYNAAITDGYTNTMLSNELQGFKVGDKAQAAIQAGMANEPGPNPFPENLQPYTTVWDGSWGFGKNSLKAALADGYSYTQLANSLDGFNVGEKAVASLNKGVADENAKYQQDIEDLKKAGEATKVILKIKYLGWKVTILPLKIPQI